MSRFLVVRALTLTAGLFLASVIIFAALRLLTFGGGANEVLKDMIAVSGLGVPPSRLP